MSAIVNRHAVGPAVMVLGAAVVLLPGCLGMRSASTMDRFSATVPAAGVTSLLADAGRDGTLSVVGGTGNSIEIEATYSVRAKDDATAKAISDALKSTPPIAAAGPVVALGSFDRLTGRFPELKPDDISIRWILRVPAGLSVDLRTMTGAAEARGLTGSLSIATDTGAVTAEGTPTGLAVKSRRGPVHVIGGGSADIRSSGSIDIANITGPLTVSGGDQPVTIRGAAMAGLAVGVDDATLTIEGQLAPTAAWTLTSDGGAIVVSLPKASAFTLSADLGKGTLSTDFPITARGDLRPGTVTGTVGDTRISSAITVRTAGGTLRLIAR